MVVNKMKKLLGIFLLFFLTSCEDASNLVEHRYLFEIIGEQEIAITRGELFEDPGYYLDDTNYTVLVDGNVNVNVVGDYNIYYSVFYDEELLETFERVVHIVEPQYGEFLMSLPEDIYEYTYDDIVSLIELSFVEITGFNEVEATLLNNKFGEFAIYKQGISKKHPDWFYEEENMLYLDDTKETLIGIKADTFEDVTIGDSVKRVAATTLTGFHHIGTLTMGNSVEKVGNYAFTGLHFQKLEFNNSLIFIGSYAFSKTSGWIEVEFPSNLKYIGDYAFEESDFLSVVLPDNPSFIGKGAFSKRIGFANFFCYDSYNFYQDNRDVFGLKEEETLVPLFRESDQYELAFFMHTSEFASSDEIIWTNRTIETWVELYHFAKENGLSMKNYPIYMLEEKRDSKKYIEEAVENGAKYVVYPSLKTDVDKIDFEQYADVIFVDPFGYESFLEETSKVYPSNFYGVFRRDADVAFLTGVLVVAEGVEKLGVVYDNHSKTMIESSKLAFKAGKEYAEKMLERDLELIESDIDTFYTEENRESLRAFFTENGVEDAYNFSPYIYEGISSLNLTEFDWILNFESEGIYTTFTMSYASILEDVLANKSVNKLFYGIANDGLVYGKDCSEILNKEFVDSVISNIKNGTLNVPMTEEEFEEFSAVHLQN